MDILIFIINNVEDVLNRDVLQKYTQEHFRVVEYFALIPSQSSLNKYIYIYFFIKLKPATQTAATFLQLHFIYLWSYVYLGVGTRVPQCM